MAAGVEFWGAEPMCTGIYIGALSAMAQMAGAVGGMFIAKVVGYVLQSRGSYMVPFLIAGSAYFIALAAIQILAPKLEPAKITETRL